MAAFLLSKDFWLATAERAAKTFAQSMLALIGTTSVGITHLDWRTDLSVAATAALASVLTSVSSQSPIVPTAPAAPAPASVVDTIAERLTK